MSSRSPVLPQFLPDTLFQQDFLVFLSFFGWMLIGLLAWTRPLAKASNGGHWWVWLGFFAFSEAVADFVKVLSFSDPFFRVFNIGSAFEMLGFGFLIELAIRYEKPKIKVPAAAIACGFLGLAMEVDSFLYTQLISFAVAIGASVAVAIRLVQEGRMFGGKTLLVVAFGVAMAAPTWLLHPERLGLLRGGGLLEFDEFPYYGFPLLFARVASAWLILSGLWVAKIGDRIGDVATDARERLRYWGFRVMPGLLCSIVLATYLITTWNGRRVRDGMESDYLFRVQTAALAVEKGFVAKTISAEFPLNLSENLRAIKNIGSDILDVYVWFRKGGLVESAPNDPLSDPASPVARIMSSEILGMNEYSEKEPFVFGPLVVGASTVLSINAPVTVDQLGVPGYWVGIDVEAGQWMKSISMARLQTIIIAGLVMALVIFFLYYQIERESEADLVLAVEKAEAADRAKSEFLAVISHEIRTPLQSVLGYSDLLRGTRLDEKQHNCLDTIQSEGKILLRIVQDILDFSNLRKANFELKDGTVYLRRLIQETYRTVSPMAERKGLRADLEIDDQVPDVVVTDGVRLRQVLLNVFGNAVKYTDKGWVRLGARFAGSQTDESGATRSGVVFEATDSGIGIKEEDLPRLFEPFIQLEHTSHFGREGAGLGLAIVKRIIELMGGSIEVESSFGVGSTFTVRFDYPEVSAEDPAAVLEAQDGVDIVEEKLLGETYPLKILVADDNPMVRRLIEQYLKSLGYEPDLVDGGKQASEKGPAYDVVIVDLRMPEVDGPTAANAIRERSGLDDQPWIIGVSATLAEPEIERALASGINEFLGKPFFAEDLGKRILGIPWLQEFAEEANRDESSSLVDVVVEESDSEVSPTGGGMGFFSDEMIDAALEEAAGIQEEIREAIAERDFAEAGEKAHYLANTAMAIGIDCLYIDSKALEKSCESKDYEASAQLLKRLLANLSSWVESR